MLNIVYATDGSDAAEAARLFLEALPLPAGTRVRVVSVLTDPTPIMAPPVQDFVINTQAFAELRAGERDIAEEAVQEAARRLAGDGVTATTELRDGDPAREILAAADEQEADLVVVGSKGLRGVEGFLLGSVARNVAKHSRRAVLVARAPLNGVRAAVVATDGSDHAKHAAAFAARFPVPEGADVTILNVIRPYTPFPGLFPTDREEFDTAVQEVREKQHEAASALTADARSRFTETGRTVHAEVHEGDPAAQILAAADEKGADLMVIGARGTSLIEGLLVGSVADRLLKEARCSVLVVP